MTTCWGPLIGSLGTPAGAGSNPLTIGYLYELTGMEVSFIDWMTFGVPSVLLLIPIAWLILSYLFPPERESLLSPAELAAIEAENHEPLTRKEKIFMMVYSLTLFLWIAGPAIEQATGGRIAPTLQNVGMAAALVLFLPGLDLVSWKSAEHDIHWGTLLVLAGGLAAGVMLYHTGAARWLAWALLGPVSGIAPMILVLTMIATICLLRLLFSSSTAATAILIPLVIVIGQDLQMDPWLFAAPAAFAINLAFILPTQAATHMVAYSAGYFSSKDLARGGALFTLIAVPVILGAIFVIGELAGRHLVP
jgi:sodium-dependent dicarboxylate transporter 2/3/5